MMTQKIMLRCLVIYDDIMQLFCGIAFLIHWGSNLLPVIITAHINYIFELYSRIMD